MLRYLHGTIRYGLLYLAGSDIQLVGYTNLDWVGSVKDQKSTSRCCFSLGSFVISWFSRKEYSIALSSEEVKYNATCMAAQEAVWLQKLLAGLFEHMLEPTAIHYDNHSCVQMSMNLVHHDQTKHVEMQYHYVRYMVLRCDVELKFVPTDEQVADMLTKPLVSRKVRGISKYAQDGG